MTSAQSLWSEKLPYHIFKIHTFLDMVLICHGQMPHAEGFFSVSAGMDGVVSILKSSDD